MFAWKARLEFALAWDLFLRMLRNAWWCNSQSICCCDFAPNFARTATCFGTVAVLAYLYCGARFPPLCSLACTGEHFLLVNVCSIVMFLSKIDLWHWRKPMFSHMSSHSCIREKTRKTFGQTHLPCATERNEERLTEKHRRTFFRT